MKKNDILITAAMAVTWFASCSSDETAMLPDTTGHHAIELTASIEPQTTRAAADLQSTTVDQSVTLGVFVSKAGGSETIANNVAYTYSTSSQSWKAASADTPVYFPTDGSAIDITVYAPYQAGILSVNDIPTAATFAVKTTQSNKADYLASDLITGSKQSAIYTGKPIAVTMQHLLSKVSVTLIPGDGISMDDLKGAMMKIGSVGMTVPSDLAADATSASQSAILSPASFASGNEFISIVLSSGAYFPYVLTSDLTLEAGKQYTYSFTLKATGISLNNASVKDWTEGGTVNDGEMTTEW